VKGRAGAGFLHLQLGQEIIYLMLAGALAAAIFMASLVAGRRELEEEIARLRAVETPPIVTLAEAQGYSFASGSADLSPEFRDLLVSNVIPQVVELSERYGATVVEVVGHTDESPIRATTPSNLDRRLLAYLDGAPGEPLHASDNAGLGLARAAAVARVIRTHPDTEGLTVIPMSAAQTTERGDIVATAGGELNEQDRRRIEIRLRRPVLQEQEAQGASAGAAPIEAVPSEAVEPPIGAQAIP
jgi:outer membrane protein OmpA-like peptidoglycan-associated protein